MKRTWLILSDDGDIMDRNDEYEFKTRDAAESYALELSGDGDCGDYRIFEAISYVERPPATLKKFK